MKKKILALILLIARHTGLFVLSRILTARNLRILCYHGAALNDENRFRPGLFMTGATFATRMRFLADAGYPILPLGNALEMLENSTLPRNATVITIDDGWYGTYKVHYPILREYGFPATLYVASYYLKNQTQVFNVALSYVLWKSGTRQIDLSKLKRILGDDALVDCVFSVEETYTRLSAAAESMEDAAARQSLLREFCDIVGVDWRALEADRLISFVCANEAREMAANGIDIQLHTHRHRFPDTGFDAARVEIEDNRRFLAGIGKSELRHFCYPSGIYSQASVAFLGKLNIESATTTNPGFNRKGAPSLELTRFLDSESVSNLEFEAELSGFFELIRRCGYRI